MFVDFRLAPIPILVAGYALAIGIFIGVLAMKPKLEVLNVMPILLRRARITRSSLVTIMFCIRQDGGFNTIFLC